MTDNRDIDELLRREGERWRSTVSPRRQLGDSYFQERRRSRGLLAAALSTSAVIVLAVVGAVLVLRSVSVGGFAPSGTPLAVAPTQSPQSPPGNPQPTISSALAPSPSARTTPTAAPTSLSPPPLSVAVQDGDRVVASGKIVDDGSGPWICRELLAVGEHLACGGMRTVSIRGLDPRTLPGSERESGAYVTTWVTVYGTWDGDALEATQAAATDEPDELVPPTVPCNAPEGGWPGGATGDDGEQAALALERHVATQPERYVGIWPAVIPPPHDARGAHAIVVGTVDDVDTEGAELAAIYPYNLCVVPVEFSARELEEVADQLSALDERWLVEVEPAADRVIVATDVFDQATAEAIAPYREMVLVHTVVRTFD